MGTIFLALFTYAIGLSVGPQFVEGLRREGAQLVTLVLVTTTTAFAIAFGGSRLFGLAPGFAPGILAGSNTISAVMGVATAAVDDGLFTLPAGMTADQVKANIAAGYSLTYILSILGIVLLVRNLPAMFGIDPVAAAKESEKKYGAKGHALPGHERGVRPRHAQRRRARVPARQRRLRRPAGVGGLRDAEDAGAAPDQERRGGSAAGQSAARRKATC